MSRMPGNHRTTPHVSGLRDLVHRPPPPPSRLPVWVQSLLRAGVASGDPEVRRRQAFANAACYIVAINAASHLITNALHDLWGLLPLHLYNFGVIVLALLLPQLHRLGEHVVVIALSLLIVIGHSFVVVALGLASDLHIYFALSAFMLFVFGVRAWRLFVGFYLATFIALIVMLWLAPVEGLLLPEDTAFRTFLSTQAIVNVMIINGIGISYTLATLSRTQTQLARQVAVSDTLLDVLLPRSVSRRLKHEGRQIADRVDNATVLFADLSGFTAAAGQVTATELVAYLDGVFTGFDGLCASHGVDKIKTMGDGYLAAGGLSGEAKAGAVAVGRLALDLLGFIARHPPLGQTPLNLRVGIHCGPLIAGVIGETRLSYDIWGDTVNVAQRMEAHGEPGRIQVSAVFRDLAGDAFSYTPRGPVEVKGSGSLETFWLQPGPAAAATPAPAKTAE
jgi:adenylate cyclase